MALLERGLVVDRLGARVDQQREVLRVLDPGRDQPPAHQGELTLALGHPHDRHRLGRRDIVARRKIGLLAIAKQRPDRLRRAGDAVASAHRIPQASYPSHRSGPRTGFLGRALTGPGNTAEPHCRTGQLTMLAPAADRATDLRRIADLPVTSGRGGPNINPATGLSTDYLNHFTEAIMLLEIVPRHARLPRRLPGMGAEGLPRALRRLPFQQPRRHHRRLRGRRSGRCSRSLDTLADLMNTLLLAHARSDRAPIPPHAEVACPRAPSRNRAEADRHARFRPDQRHRSRPEQPDSVPQAAIDAMFRR